VSQLSCSIIVTFLSRTHLGLRNQAISSQNQMEAHKGIKCAQCRPRTRAEYMNIDTTSAHTGNVNYSINPSPMAFYKTPHLLRIRECTRICWRWKEGWIGLWCGSGLRSRMLLEEFRQWVLLCFFVINALILKYRQREHCEFSLATQSRASYGKMSLGRLLRLPILTLERVSRHGNSR